MSRRVNRTYEVHWTGLSLITTSILFVVLLIGSVQGQQVYTQPMYETHWKSRIITVSIPSTSTSYEQSTFTYEMSNWNKAQAWFVQSYYPTDYPQDIFTLQLASQGQLAQVAVQYVSSIPSVNGIPIGGETLDYGRQITILINSGPYPFSGLLVEHELGHVLGLADNSVGSQDLMFFSSTGTFSDFPSTLDLYGIYKEAKCLCYMTGDTITLPASIPYVSEAWNSWHPPVVIPEFPSTSLLSIAAFLSTFFIFRRLRSQNLDLELHDPDSTTYFQKHKGCDGC